MIYKNEKTWTTKAMRLKKESAVIFNISTLETMMDLFEEKAK